MDWVGKFIKFHKDLLSCFSDFSPGVVDVNLYLLGASLITRLVKNLPAMQETWVQSLG